MKKLIVMMLALAMISGICACSKKDETSKPESAVEKVETKAEEKDEVKKEEKPAQKKEEAKEEKQAEKGEKQQPPANTDAKPQEEDANADAATSETVVNDSTNQPSEAPAAKPATKEEASKFIGQSADALVAAIGQPGSKTYASSCIGDGEDGEWYYDGFTVYTYRENGSERVEDVF